MKKLTLLVIVLGILLAVCHMCSAVKENTVVAAKSIQSTPVTVNQADPNTDEILALQSVFTTDVSATVIADQDYLNAVISLVQDKLSKSARGQDSQYFIFVDRNALKQNIMVGFYNAADKNIFIIGWDKVSTGNPSRTRHYITPTGIFENSVKNMSFRAQGTKNKKGWMGFGVKGSRVWDFGWQESVRDGRPFNIRMMMHATDPNFGEPRLGKRDSKGCIRVSAKMNKFLDIYGIIDKDYEDHPKQGNRVLRKDRKTVSLPGRHIIIGDF